MCSVKNVSLGGEPCGCTGLGLRVLVVQVSLSVFRSGHISTNVPKRSFKLWNLLGLLGLLADNGRHVFVET